MKIQFSRNQVILFTTAVTAFVFLSPKWLVPVAAWLAPALLIIFNRNKSPWKAFVGSVTVLFIANIIGNYKVFPFPVFFLIPMSLQLALLGSIPYWLHRWLSPKIAGPLSTLVFPAVAVAYEYLSSFSGGGTWGSIANSQADYLALVQLASITGIWGVSFLIYWFASLLAWIVDQQFRWTVIRTPSLIYATLFLAVLLFGTFRINIQLESPRNTVRVAGITALNLVPLMTIYEDAFNRKLEVDPSTLTQSSPELQELNKALALFIENPFDTVFNDSHKALDQFQNSMFSAAAREARGGAKVVAFSEALMFTVKPVEEKVIEKARNLAKEHQIRLVLALGSFIPGKVEMGKKYIENKAIMINEKGEVENIFFKNKPVPIVEGSVPGDGKIPVVETRWGRIATSICYDADFPSLMRRASDGDAGLMILPSGDWREVSPYHANMARLRAIENGFSLLRPVSGATSIVCDQKGRLIAASNFYDKGTGSVLADVPVKKVFTIYGVAGDVLPIICIASALVLAGVGLRQSGTRKITQQAAA